MLCLKASALVYTAPLSSSQFVLSVFIWGRNIYPAIQLIVIVFILFFSEFNWTRGQTSHSPLRFPVIKLVTLVPCRNLVYLLAFFARGEKSLNVLARITMRIILLCQKKYELAVYIFPLCMYLKSHQVRWSVTANIKCDTSMGLIVRAAVFCYS